MKMTVGEAELRKSKWAPKLELTTKDTPQSTIDEQTKLSSGPATSPRPSDFDAPANSSRAATPFSLVIVANSSSSTSSSPTLPATKPEISAPNAPSIITESKQIPKPKLNYDNPAKQPQYVGFYIEVATTKPPPDPRLRMDAPLFKPNAVNHVVRDQQPATNVNCDESSQPRPTKSNWKPNLKAVPFVPGSKSHHTTALSMLKSNAVPFVQNANAHYTTSLSTLNPKASAIYPIRMWLSCKAQPFVPGAQKHYTTTTNGLNPTSMPFVPKTIPHVKSKETASAEDMSTTTTMATPQDLVLHVDPITIALQAQTLLSVATPLILLPTIAKLLTTLQSAILTALLIEANFQTRVQTLTA